VGFPSLPYPSFKELDQRFYFSFIICLVHLCRGGKTHGIMDQVGIILFVLNVYEANYFAFQGI
jgi:hypothetical protein